MSTFTDTHYSHILTEQGPVKFVCFVHPLTPPDKEEHSQLQPEPLQLDETVSREEFISGSDVSFLLNESPPYQGFSDVEAVQSIR